MEEAVAEATASFGINGRLFYSGREDYENGYHSGHRHGHE